MRVVERYSKLKTGGASHSRLTLQGKRKRIRKFEAHDRFLGRGMTLKQAQAIVYEGSVVSLVGIVLEVKTRRHVFRSKVADSGRG